MTESWSGHLHLWECEAKCWRAGVGWSKDTAVRRWTLKFCLSVLTPEVPDAILQSRAFQDTIPQVTLVKYCAYLQTLIVPMGTDVVDRARGTHHFCITSTFQGKNNTWGKGIGRISLILIPLIKQCPELSQMKSKDASSKLYSKISTEDRSRAITFLEF